MDEDTIIEFLAQEKCVCEAYVLIRELKMFLDVGYDVYRPSIRVKIWKSNVMPKAPYSFTVSHHVHTPVQAGPYYPSNVHAETEERAIKMAISTTISYLRSAIEKGHEPKDGWLVSSSDY